MGYQKGRSRIANNEEFFNRLDNKPIGIVYFLIMTEHEGNRGLKTIVEAVGRRLSRRPDAIDGFVLEKDKKGEWVYRVESKYINADRNAQVMPVRPEYETISGVEILGNPSIVVDQESAASPRRPDLSGVSKITERHFPQLVDERVKSPAEVTAFASNVFVFPVIDVEITHGEQRLGQRTGQTEVKDAFPYPFTDDVIDLEGPAPDKVSGLAYVAHVRVPVDFRNFFATPKQMHEFEEQQLALRDAAVDSMSLRLFNKLFREKLNNIGREVSHVRGKFVKGVLLSPIKTHYRLSDNIITINSNPKGEAVIAATYLV